MNLYELLVIIRYDVSSLEVDKVNAEIANIIQESNIIKKEYWGLRYLPYPIKKNNKAHFSFMGINTDPTTLNELKRRMTLNDNIIRFNIIRVKTISESPSPLLKDFDADSSKSVNVTLGGQ